MAKISINMISIKTITVLLLMCFCNLLIAQPDIMNNITKVLPQSIDAGAGNNGLYTTSIPIHNFKGREMNLPISMSYTASGIKVDQIASQIGLGWNLNVGGRIERVVVGEPDGLINNNPGLGCRPSEYLDDVEARDYFAVNANGYSDVLRYPTHSTVVVSSITDPTVKVEVPNNDQLGPKTWIVTDRDGNKYYFGQDQAIETIDTYSSYSNIATSPINYSLGFATCEQIQMKYRTSWMLTKIESKNGLDVFEFVYQKFDWGDNYIANNGEGYKYGRPGPPFAEYRKLNSSRYSLLQQMLSEIKYNGDKIIELYYGPREDLRYDSSFPGNKLQNINFLRYGDDVTYNFVTSKYYKKVDFNYSYFGNTDPNVSNLHRRLKLDNIAFKGFISNSNEVVGDVYKFDYFSPASVPPINSYAQDLLGLYNGKTTNIDLIPENGSRSYDFDSSKIGTLSSITYPTKGYSIFEYEQNALNGGYGREYIPPVTAVQYQVVDLANIVDLGICEEIDPRYNTINQSYMANIDLSQFQDSPFNTSDFIDNVSTTVLDLSAATEPTTCYIRTNKFGIYAIHQIPNCNGSAVLSDDCDGDGSQTSYDGCLTETQYIYYTSASSSHNFLKTGFAKFHTFDDTDQQVNLPPGKYQLTLWSVPGNEWHEGDIKIYKKIPYTVVVSQGYYRDLDKVSENVPGFRIKSITNYSDGNKFAGKKLYRYAEGKIDSYSNTYTKWFAFVGDIDFTVSKGYANAPEIIHYSKVFEADVDENNKNNGYICNTYEFAFHESGVGQVRKYPFHAENNPEGNNKVYFTGGFVKNALRGRSIYNYNDQLLRKEIFSYDAQSFCLELDEINQYDCIRSADYVFLTQKEIEHHFGLNNSITEKTTYLYDEDYYSYKPYQIVTNGDVTSYEYLPNDISPAYLQNKVTDIKSIAGGYTKINYSDINSRHLVTSIDHSKTEDISQAPLERTTEYEYDDDGNLVTTIKYNPGGNTPASYETMIYGYQNRFVVAKIIGLKYSDILAVSPQLITDIKEISALQPNLDNDTTLRSKLNLLRTDTNLTSNFPNTLITTYTYNPDFGVTSVTDTKGYTIFTEYDELGRIKFTKEKFSPTESLILSENQYHTRN